MLLLQQGVAVEIPKFEVAIEDGTYAIEGFTVIFTRQDDTERKKRLKKSMKALKKAGGFNEALTNMDISEDDLDKIQSEIDKSEAIYEKQLFEDILSWRGLTDIDGTEVKHTKSNKRELLKSVPFREAILEVWSAATGGITPKAEVEATSKN